TVRVKKLFRQRTETHSIAPPHLRSLVLPCDFLKHQLVLTTAELGLLPLVRVVPLFIFRPYRPAVTVPRATCPVRECRNLKVSPPCHVVLPHVIESWCAAC